MKDYSYWSSARTDSRTPHAMNGHHSHRRRLWRAAVVAAATAAFVNVVTTPAHAEVRTKIITIGDQYSIKHSAEMKVVPGAALQLSADEADYTDLANPQPLSRQVENFVWNVKALDYDSNNVFQSEECDPERQCGGPFFQLTSYGVVANIPYQMPHALVLSVHSKQASDRFAEDRVVLVNTSYNDSTPAEAYADFDNLPTNVDVRSALAGHGRWVMVEGEWWFDPFVYEADWQPMRHGKWYWAKHNGINTRVWRSFDPWGEITDHTGIWRYHNVYGWIWCPFRDHHWEPVVASWFYHDDGVAWYPYWSGYTYREGYGWADGFWLERSRHIHSSGYRWGWTYVGLRHFNADDISIVFASTYVTVNIINVWNMYWSRPYYYNDAWIYNYTYSPRIFFGELHPVPRVIAGYGSVPWYRPSVPAPVIPPRYLEYRDTGWHNGHRAGPAGNMPPAGSVYRPGEGYAPRPNPIVIAPRVPGRDGRFVPMPSRITDPGRVQIPGRVIPAPVLGPRPEPGHGGGIGRPLPGPTMSAPRPEPSRPEPPRYEPPRIGRPSPSFPTPSRPQPPSRGDWDRPSNPAPIPSPRRDFPSHGGSGGFGGGTYTHPSRPAPSAPSIPSVPGGGYHRGGNGGGAIRPSPLPMPGPHGHGGRH